VRIEHVDESWERDSELADLLYHELYRSFGVSRDAEWRHAENGSVTVVALGSHDELLGTARLLPGAGERSRQVRQVAVSSRVRTAGVGRALMAALEAEAAADGASEVWLNARDTAVAFYKRLGYQTYGGSFVSELTGIEHIAMRKTL